MSSAGAEAAGLWAGVLPGDAGALPRVTVQGGV